MSFDKFLLNECILRAIKDAGYEKPTDIQSRAIPEALLGHDLFASAQTGTGKTAAFIIPTLERLVTPSTNKNSKGPRVLVLTPTRELALQVSASARKYGKYLKRLSIVSIIGSMPYHQQRRELSRPVDIMVATPGRLLDYMERGEMDFSRMEVLVLDEADRMLDMGFRDPVRDIADATPATRQTLLFSATLDGSIANLARHLLKNPKRIEVAPSMQKHLAIEQHVKFVNDLRQKRQALGQIIDQTDVTQMIVFTATKHGAETLANDLKRDGHSAAALHGDMRQGARTRTISQMHRGDVRVLVATDVAARGLDVNGVSHVINYDLPRASTDYVHRIGRTGRAGAKGTAISLAVIKERGQFRRLEKGLGYNIKLYTAGPVANANKPYVAAPVLAKKAANAPRYTQGKAANAPRYTLA